MAAEVWLVPDFLEAEISEALKSTGCSSRGSWSWPGLPLSLFSLRSQKTFFIFLNVKFANFKILELIQILQNTKQSICGVGSGLWVTHMWLQDSRTLEHMGMMPDCFPVLEVISRSQMMQHRCKATGVDPVVLYQDLCRLLLPVGNWLP